jgi:hypothetical protein
MSAINTATCAVCNAFAEGIELTQEQVNELEVVRIGGQVISKTAANPQEPTDPMSGVAKNPEDAYKGKKGYWLKALVVNMRAVAGAIVDTIKEPASKTLAKEKRRKRIFELDIDDPDNMKKEINDD